MLTSTYYSKFFNKIAKTSKFKHNFNLTNNQKNRYMSTLTNNSYSVKNSINHINPWFITGLIDAEGTFNVGIFNSLTTNIGYRVAARFQITLHVKDLSLLKEMKSFFGDVGNIIIFKNTCSYRIDSLTLLIDKVIPHFDKYPLITQKLADYLLFKEIVLLMKNKEHVTLNGLIKILSLRASLNLGLSDKLKNEFPNIVATTRPLINNKDIPNPEWMAGFTSGDGSFYITIRQNNSLKQGFRVELGFSITQHSRDLYLLEKFVSYFNCGRIKKDNRNPVHYFIVSNIEDISTKIIPFFQKYKILGVKSEDFNDWCKAAELFKGRAQLSKEGLLLFSEIQSSMNSKRLIK